jgi:PmbA protein
MTGDDGHEHLLAVAAKVSEACEVLSIETFTSRATMGRAGTVVLGESTGGARGIRLVRNGRTGTAGATSMADDSILVDMAIADSRTGPEENLRLPSSVDPSPVTLYDASLEDMEPRKLAGLILELGGVFRESSPYGAVTGSLELSRKSVRLANSKGLSCGYEKLFLEWRVRFSFPTGDGFFSTGVSASSGCPDFDPGSLAREASVLGGWAASTARVPGSRAALFLPAPLSVLMQAVRTGVSGRSLVNGSSPLAGCVGTRVVSDLVTIRDRPLLDMGSASAPFDAEGVATCDKTIFDRGVFRGFLFDLATAAESGTRSTGNAGRNLDGKPEPVCTNLTMDTGKASVGSMISSMESGVLVSDILSGEGSNAVSGDFAFDGCNAFAVESGEVTGRIPGALVGGNVYELLGGVVSIGESPARAGSDIFPAVLSGGIRISGG